jgi:hypothetical protein
MVLENAERLKYARVPARVTLVSELLAVSVRTYLTLRLSADVLPRFSMISNSTR